MINSKQRPRKLTIYGSDGREYQFLLKGHEDLRQDERVMQARLLCLVGMHWPCDACTRGSSGTSNHSNSQWYQLKMT